MDAFYWQPKFRALDAALELHMPYVKQLAAIATGLTNGDHGGITYTDKGVRYLRGQAVTEFGLQLKNDELYISEEDHLRMIRAEVLPGDVLYTIAGSTGNACVVSGIERANINQAIVRVRPDNSIYPQFLADFLNSSLGRLQGERKANGGVQLNINFSEVKSLQIIIPPLDIQRHLVAELDAARGERDRALVEADRLLSTFEPWAIKEMGLTPPKEDARKVYAIPRNAATTRIDPFFHAPDFVEIERVIQAAPHAPLGSLVKFSSDTWNAKKHPEPTFRYIEISGVDRRRGQAKTSEVSVADAPSRARMIVQPEDIIISLTRPHHGSIALLNGFYEGCIASTGFAVIRNVDEKRISRPFLWAVLRLSLSLKQMLRRASGGNYPAITQDELAKVLIPLPDRSAQESIVEEVVQRNNEADRLEAHAETVWCEARERFEQQLLQGGKA